MASRQQLRRRITSVKNTRQITKAMEMVSASKLRRAQASALSSKDFAEISVQLLSRIRQLTDVSKHQMFQRRDIKRRLLIVVASDSSLAGAYNYNVHKQLVIEAGLDKKANIKTSVITVGKQATQFTSKIKGIEIIGAYHDFIASPKPEHIKPIARMVIDKFCKHDYDAVDIIYTKFISTVNLVPTTYRLLPAAFEDVDIPSRLNDAVFEPSPMAVLSEISERFIEVQIMQDSLEAAASEHSSRMIAMKNATDNAGDIVDDLTLALNTARQAAITQELAEITGGAEALS